MVLACLRVSLYTIVYEIVYVSTRIPYPRPSNNVAYPSLPGADDEASRGLVGLLIKPLRVPAGSGTGTSSALLCYACATPCPYSRQRLYHLRNRPRRMCYEMPGTDVAHAATRLLLLGADWLAHFCAAFILTVKVSAYASAMPCPYRPKDVLCEPGTDVAHLAASHSRSRATQLASTLSGRLRYPPTGVLCGDRY
eukprot:2757728-Rhodomonas_salina.5